MLLLELFANMTPKLYHGTSSTNATQILDTNRIEGTKWHDEVVDNQSTVSTSRSFDFAWSYGKQQCVFELDAIKLRQDYKIVPVDYFKGSPYNGTYYRKRKESEEAVIGNIAPLSKYLLAIWISRSEKYDLEAEIHSGNNWAEGYKELLKHPLLKVMKSNFMTKDQKHEVLARNPGTRFEPHGDDQSAFDKAEQYDTVY
jgi:RNA:NAD 2'-phosphotransferase (TPT1/KptA family)